GERHASPPGPGVMAAAAYHRNADPPQPDPGRNDKAQRGPGRDRLQGARRSRTPQSGDEGDPRRTGGQDTRRSHGRPTPRVREASERARGPGKESPSQQVA